MKITILEPLGVPGDTLVHMMQEAVGADVEIQYYDTRKEDTETLIERSRDADAVVLSNFKYPRQVMEHCPKLKYICVAFTGYDHVDMDYCRQRGIQVSNCAGYSTAAVADLVFGLLIGLYRNIIPCNEAVRRAGTKAGLVGPELEGKKFGIIGAGAIGLRVAKIAQAFGCEVYAHSRTVKQVDGVMFTDLDVLLKTCDIVSLHVPQNASTVGMIGKEKIALMKTNAVLINTARGPIVDSAALAEALNNGKIAGAGIDVFEKEPPIDPSHPLIGAKNCILTPHVGFATFESMYKRAEIVGSNLKSYLEGHPENLVK
ncbi:MAG: 2-hydroxyacid dehydrogenase [Ethanoligenens sp.]|uniref:2-hydroxyacid dehydrogenase n=1 Tax=Ethanoligenens sp. TaxID=2099655 RepID=UPI0039ECCB5A